MQVLVRDVTSVIPYLRDGAPTAGPTSAITMTGAGTYFTDSFSLERYVEAIAFCNVTANSGTTPTMDIAFQISYDQKTWTDAGDAFTQVTTTNSQTIKKLTANFGRYLRARIILAGTSPSYTFSLVIVAKA